jgi:carboxypeptidase Taq
LHKLKVDPAIRDRVHELAASDWVAKQPAEVQANVREMKRELDRASRLPQPLVEQLATACSLGQSVWVEARREQDFKKFLPRLKTIFDLKREQASALGFSDSPYDALLDEYEPYATSKEVGTVLDQLCNALRPLLERIASRTDRPNVEVLRRVYPIPAQENFARLAAERIGFDFTRGRLDVTHHPFCTELGPDDVRLTTRYQERLFNSAFFGVLHEAGHGIYEQGLNGNEYGMPAGKFASLGVHESQSRLWENLVGRNRGFWHHFFAEAQKRFPDALSDVTPDTFHRAINDVRPSLIRVEADEATYNLHIAIRFQLERQLVEGQLACDDLPEAWNANYEKYLGIRPANDSEGVMQDIHWSAGLIGYFPTYSLGNLYAAQLFNAAKRDLGNLPEMFARGEFLPLKEWLNQRVHQMGQTLPARELIESITGEPLTHKPLVDDLEARLDPN